MKENTKIIKIREVMTKPTVTQYRQLDQDILLLLLLLTAQHLALTPIVLTQVVLALTPAIQDILATALGVTEAVKVIAVIVVITAIIEHMGSGDIRADGHVIRPNLEICGSAVVVLFTYFIQLLPFFLN